LFDQKTGGALLLDGLKIVAFIIILSAGPIMIINTVRMARMKNRDPWLWGILVSVTFWAIFILYQLEPKGESAENWSAERDNEIKRMRDFPVKILLGGICLAILVVILKTC